MTDEELEQLLPWYVNDTLSETEKSAVEELLGRSETARQELAFLRSLRGQIEREEIPEPSTLGWHRLRRDLRGEQRGAKSSRLQQWWKPGIAAAVVAIVALQVMVVMRQPAPYEAQLLSQSGQQLQQSQWLVQLRFAEGSSWQQVMAVIQSVDGRIVDGPSGIGIVRVRVPEQQSRFADKDQLLSWLRQQTGVSHAAIEEP